MSAHAQPLPGYVDALIGEAKERMRRRRLLRGTFFAGLAALAVALTLALWPAGSDGLRGTSGGRWVPQGVTEVDVHGLSPGEGSALTPISLRVTDPTQVDKIAAWFNGLTPNARGVTRFCASVPGSNVNFMFRGANGDPLAEANTIPGPTRVCDPVQFFTRVGVETLLYDPDRASSLMGRVEKLLGVEFRSNAYYG
jgi:hypothetical protein